MLKCFTKHFMNEYFIGEEILPSNQKQMIEQTKSTCSSLGRAFEEQIKTVENQAEKQIKSIQNQEKIEKIRKYTCSHKDSLLISKQKGMFNKLFR